MTNEILKSHEGYIVKIETNQQVHKGIGYIGVVKKL